MRGVQAGALVLAGIVIGGVATAVFHLLAGRWLGPDSYADLAALLALLGLITFPLAGAQLNVARGVAHARATGDHYEISRIYRRHLGWTVSVGACASLALALAAPWVSDILDLDENAVVITAVAVLPGFALPVVVGLIQGLQRFLLFAAAQIAVPVLRTLLLLVVVAAEGGVAGVLGANAAAFLGTFVALIWLLRSFVRRPRKTTFVTTRVRSMLVPAIGGILAFTSLTTLDIVVAKLTLPDEVAGLYGAASVLGRLILFLPAAVAAVLLPRVTARSALGRETRSLLLLSMAATGVVALLTTSVYALAPELLLRLAYGEDFVAAAPLLWKFGLAMTLFAVVNVLFVYDIGRSRLRTSALMAAGAIVQVAGFALFHASASQLIAVDIAVGAALTVAAFTAVWFRRTSPQQQTTAAVG